MEVVAGGVLGDLAVTEEVGLADGVMIGMTAEVMLYP